MAITPALSRECQLYTNNVLSLAAVLNEYLVDMLPDKKRARVPAFRIAAASPERTVSAMSHNQRLTAEWALRFQVLNMLLLFFFRHLSERTEQSG